MIYNLISFVLFIWFATAIPSIMMTRCSSVVTLIFGFIATSCCEFASSLILCRMDDLSVQLRGCPSLKNSAFATMYNSKFPRASWAQAVFVLLSRILLVDFSPHATVQLCCQLFFNHLVVYFKRFQIRYISVESIRNKILIRGMSNAGMINHFCCKQRW